MIEPHQIYFIAYKKNVRLSCKIFHNLVLTFIANNTKKKCFGDRKSTSVIHSKNTTSPSYVKVDCAPPPTTTLTGYIKQWFHGVSSVVVK